MSSLANIRDRILPMSTISIDKVKALESESLKLPQVAIQTKHILHGGMYARTIMIPAGTILTGALIKISTILIAQGDVVAYLGDESVEMSGHNVLPASANRKQAFLTKTDTYLTMIFPSNAKTVEEAENEFTDEASALFSRSGSNHITITGE